VILDCLTVLQKDTTLRILDCFTKGHNWRSSISSKTRVHLLGEETRESSWRGSPCFNVEVEAVQSVLDPWQCAGKLRAELVLVAVNISCEHGMDNVIESLPQPTHSCRRVFCSISLNTTRNVQ